MLLVMAVPASAQVTVTQVSIDAATTGASEFRASGGGFFPLSDFGQMVLRASYRTVIWEGGGTLLSAAPGSLSFGTNWELGATASLLVYHQKVDRSQAHRRAYEVCASECANQPDSAFCQWSKLEATKRLAEQKRKQSQKLSLCTQVAADAAKLEKAEKRIGDMNEGPEKDDAWVSLATKRGELLLKCSSACDDPFSESDTAYCAHREALPQTTPTGVKDSTLCEQGQEELRRVGFVGPSFPSAMVNLGGRGGAKQLTFLSGPEGTPLTKEDKLFAQWSAGVSAWKFLPSEDDHREGWTMEVLAAFATQFEPSSTTVRACAPKGFAASGGTMVALESCNDYTLGRPTRASTVKVAFYGGWASAAKDYRLALGVDATIGLDGVTSTALALPLTLRVAGDGTYKGLVRIAASVAFKTEPGRPGALPVFGVTLALLGQRALFTDDFDRL